MFLSSFPKYAYVIMDVNYTGQSVCYLVHANLNDSLAHYKTKDHT